MGITEEMASYQRLRKTELAAQRDEKAQKKAAAVEERAKKRAAALEDGQLTAAKKARLMKGMK